MSEGEGSEDDNVVVLPVSNYPSDGTEATWRLNDPQFKYRQIDDTRWRLALAEMWVDKTGAKEPGKFYIVVCFAECECYSIGFARQINICDSDQACPDAEPSCLASLLSVPKIKSFGFLISHASLTSCVLTASSSTSSASHLAWSLR